MHSFTGQKFTSKFTCNQITHVGLKLNSIQQRLYKQNVHNYSSLHLNTFVSGPRRKKVSILFINKCKKKLQTPLTATDRKRKNHKKAMLTTQT